jgi:tetratricopeptide (TPR) repeat protein
MTTETMGTEDSFTDRLSDYLDDELSPAERAEVETHLVGCSACRATLAELRTVIARAGSLSDTPPSADLWPGVEAQIAPSRSVLPFASARRRFSFTLPQLVAASLAMMVTSGGLVWVLHRSDSRVSAPVAATNATPAPVIGDPVTTEPDEARPARVSFADAHYDEAIADLEKTLDDGRSRLDPETVRVLEANLMAIDQAIDQCRKALRNDPSNVYLNNHFVESRNRKLALLRRATALTMETGS